MRNMMNRHERVQGVRHGTELLSAADGTQVIALSPTGVLRIEGANPLLSAAEVCRFVAYQVAQQGWMPAGTGFGCP